MSDKKELTPLEKVQAKREAMRLEWAAAEAAQNLIDQEALVDLEDEYGFGSVVSLKVPGFKKGLPTLAVVRSPGGGTGYYTKYKDQVRRAGKDAKKIGEAQEQIGEACLVYPPEGDLRKSMLEAFPGLMLSAGIAAVGLAELSADDEKKG